MMERRSRESTVVWLFSIAAAVLVFHSDARVTPRNPVIKQASRVDIHALIDDVSLIFAQRHDDVISPPSNAQPYVSSPFTLPPYDSLPPITSPDNSPPYCIYPPSTPTTPSPFQVPPEGPISITPSPPEGPISITPSPPSLSPNPPIISAPTPPYSFEPSPPEYTPAPPLGFTPYPPIGFAPGPPVFQPPVVFPPPVVPPSPPTGGGQGSLWCVAKPSVPGPIIQEAMNYACGSGADCSAIQSGGACFQPDTLLAHASYAFNSYWQRTKVAGGSCEFGGTAMLVTVDPSYDGCHFLYN